MSHRAVLFDLGGVVYDSPLHAIAAFERDRGLERGFVARVIGAGGEQGAWSRLERGELQLEAWHAPFAAECQAAGHALDTRALMDSVRGSSSARPAMLVAIECIRQRGLLAAALTNNWAPEGESGPRHELHACFDRVFESSVLGLRKPDPRIYRHACAELGVEPAEAVFLDDIGANLKSARALGMHTIKVDAPGPALAELEQVLGFPLS